VVSSVVNAVLGPSGPIAYLVIIALACGSRPRSSAGR
jgi:hypothetical protein